MAMRGVALLPSMITRTLVCVDKTESHDIAGRIFNQYMPNPVEFGTCYEMLRGMEEFFDRICFPYSHYQTRGFNRKSRQVLPRKRESEAVQYMSNEAFANESGKKATFVVQVQFRQHATWQGNITWNEGKKTIKFRSALELLKLMDSALSSDGTGDSFFTGDEAL